MTKQKTNKELAKLVSYMCASPMACFTVYESEIYHNGELVCELESHIGALQAIRLVRESMAKVA